VYNWGANAPFTPQLAKASKAKLPHTLVTGPDGRKYQTFELTGPGVTKVGESGKPWRGFDPSEFGRHWANRHSVMDEWDSRGLIHYPANGGFPRRRAEDPFDADSRTFTVGDIWTDIDRINQAADERTGYPTQKPESLLARIVQASSAPGDIVLDVFVGAGTTAAVAEKLGRRWVAVDCGKLAVYTTQKRMLGLHALIGNDGPKLSPKPFTLYNAGLYDFSKLRELSWESWRFFALQLFQCRDEPHKIGGMQLDGYLKGGSVLVFNHQKQPGVRIDEETVRSLHEALGSKVGRRLYIVAPALVFDFQQDYVDCGSVRYYALRIPYSIIHELHQREFTALKQPSDEMAVNDTVEAVGFDFIRPPELEYEIGVNQRKGELLKEAFIRIKTFRSEAVVREPLRKRGNLETLSMVMLDYDFDTDTDVFDMDDVFYADAIEKDGWEVRFPTEALGASMMAVFVDIYGNEARELIPAERFDATGQRRKAPAKKAKRARK
jgi:site-specific DNA-methyltransferase (adenine-specific)/adenine-specific DNA-methyltransferase